MLVIGVYINGLIETDLNRHQDYARFVIIDHCVMLRMLLGYMRDFKNWKYVCSSCHVKLDYTNGTRKIENISGERNPMFGKKPTDETKLMVILAKDSRKFALMNFMSGTFHTLKQEWMKGISIDNRDNYISSNRKRGGHV